MGTPTWHYTPQTITYSESRLLIDVWREHFHQKLLQLSYWPLAWALLFFILFHCKVERLRDFQINLSDWECRFPEICPNLHTPEVKNLCQFNRPNPFTTPLKPVHPKLDDFLENLHKGVGGSFRTPKICCIFFVLKSINFGHKGLAPYRKAKKNTR